MGQTVVDADTEVVEPLVDRILAAVVRCIARWGVAKTTLDDVAREAGCSRATVYRAVPGGRQALLLGAAQRELRCLEASLAADLDRAEDLEDLLVTAVERGSAAVQGHEALGFLLTHEPEHVLPWVSFDGLDPLLAQVSDFAEPWLARHLPAGAPPGLAAELGELLARLVASYALEPSEYVDPAGPEGARHLVRTYVLPGVDVALTSAGTPPVDRTS